MYIERIDTKTNGTEYSPEIDHPYIVNLFLTKKQIQFNVGRMVFAINGVETSNNHMGRKWGGGRK